MKKLIVPLIVGIILIGGVVFLSLQKSTSSISSQSSSSAAASRIPLPFQFESKNVLRFF
jgi:hypothetical protein